jgi:AhpD family alkylhydroperoxidase
MDLSQVMERLSREQPEVAGAIQSLRGAILKSSPLDRKTANLVAIGVATAMRNREALAGHLTLAKEAGATREEVVSAILLALPSGGVPAALSALPLAWEHFS